MRAIEKWRVESISFGKQKLKEVIIQKEHLPWCLSIVTTIFRAMILLNYILTDGSQIYKLKNKDLLHELSQDFFQGKGMGNTIWIFSWDAGMKFQIKKFAMLISNKGGRQVKEQCLTI